MDITERVLAAASSLRLSSDRFALYNFHQSELLRTLEATVGGSSQHSTVFLIGEQGIGRSYLLDAVAHSLSPAGKDVSVLHVDLEGFEPEQGLSSFLRYKFLKHGSPVVGESEPRLQVGDSASTWAALSVALLYSCPTIEHEFQFAGFGDFAPDGLTDRERLLLLLQRLTTDRRIVLHLTDICYIPEPVLQALSAAAEANDNLLIAVSCGVNELAGRVPIGIPGHSASISLSPLTSLELQSVVDRNFTPNSFPARFSQRLYESSRGLPSLVSALMYDLVSRGLILQGDDGTWRIPDDVLSELESHQSFAAVPAFFQKEDDLKSAVLRPLPQYLFLAGTCGDNVPAGLLLEHLGLTGEFADQFVEFVDASLTGETSLFTDFQYLHPSFPEQAVYRFNNSLARRAALESVPLKDRSRLTSEFWRFLKNRSHADTRGACRLLLSVGSGLYPAAEHEDCLRELAWWVCEEDGEELTNFLREAMAQNQVAPENIWSTYETTAGRWLPYRRMFLLEAYRRHPAGMAGFRTCEIHLACAELLRDSGKIRESVGEALSALEVLKDDPTPRGLLLTKCHALIGRGYRELGNQAEARQHLECAVEAIVEAGDKPSPALVNILHDLAEGFRDLDDNKIAARLLKKAFEGARQLYGLEDPLTNNLLKTRADVLSKVGDLDGVRNCLERALAVERRISGSESLQITVILKTLADTLRALHQPRRARSLLEEALAIETTHYGEQDPQVGILRAVLVDLLLELGKLEAARSHLKISLNVMERMTGGGSEEVSMLLKHLADLSAKLGDQKASRQYLQRALSIDETILGIASPQVAVQVKMLADIFWETGDAEGTVSCLRRALRIEEEIYGKEDVRILQNLKCLEEVLRKTGNINAADECLSKLRNIEVLKTN